jgi:uncharacterized protein YcfJ
MWRSTALIAVLTVAACSEAPPSGPSVMALPATGKTLESFQQDDATCRGYAAQVVGPVATSDNTLGGGALLGTVLGAGVGAALGSVGGAAGAGAAIGGATGLIAGTAIGANNAQAISSNAQTRYDTAYTQCMYSKGHTVQTPPRYAYDYGSYYDYFPYGYRYPYAYGPLVLGFGFDGFHHFHHEHHEFYHGGMHHH